MALIDALIDRVADPTLRQALRDQVNTMLIKKSFGLVYQQHKPETVELPNYKVRPGCKVRIRSEQNDELYVVEKIRSDQATLLSLTDEPKRWNVAISEIVVVREFGEPVYPGLHSVGRLQNAGNDPPHLVINSENFHALETLLYTHENKIDCIYIDPPYNSGARDWKYNNDYVDGVDQYRHSKWLAFMERRLKLAKRLLNPVCSVLIVTIDEKEVHHLGMLLEQLFPTELRQMITLVTNQRGVARGAEFARVDEYAHVVFIGDMIVTQGSDDLLTSDETSARQRIDIWNRLMRRGTDARRQDSKNLFYPIFADPEKRAIIDIGEPLPLSASRHSIKAPRGLVAVWPIRTDGTEGRWTVGHVLLRKYVAQGMAKLGAYNKARDQWSISYLISKDIKRIEQGEIRVDGRDENGVLLLSLSDEIRRNKLPRTVWHRDRHNAGTYGSELLSRFIPGRKFPFPKSLYAVEDMIRVFLSDKPDAVILDFFAGSGTTAHAVALLNSKDGGHRQTILVTNNEVSASESTALRRQGLSPGDPAWEENGIFYHFTKPRMEAAITGVTHEGSAVRGEYLDGAEFGAGLKANVEFFNLTYEDPDLINLGRKFSAVAPLLWMKAGARGERIDQRVESWTLPSDAIYGVLFDTDQWRDFVTAVVDRRDFLTHVFVVTDSESTFDQIASEIPTGINCSRLYDDYLHTFEINTRGRS